MEPVPTQTQALRQLPKTKHDSFTSKILTEPCVASFIEKNWMWLQILQQMNELTPMCLKAEIFCFSFYTFSAPLWSQILHIDNRQVAVGSEHDCLWTLY